MSRSRTGIERARLEALIERERELFRERTPRSRALAAAAREVQIFGVPMPWMAKWVGGYPLFYAEARGARVVDVDGNAYIDFALGDTGSMPGAFCGRPRCVLVVKAHGLEFLAPERRP